MKKIVLMLISAGLYFALAGLSALPAKDALESRVESIESTLNQFNQ